MRWKPDYLIQIASEHQWYDMCKCYPNMVNDVFKALVKQYPDQEFRVINSQSNTIYGKYDPAEGGTWYTGLGEAL